ncbi:MAG: enoyl-CoA hydratase/isomerase family protein [Alphaproteobacteria bacterium]|nr:enoyl-CoA hydratase/isomerase family protein [Alphaproteobacteria bacterium]
MTAALPECRWLLLQRQGFHLTIVLNRPTARNAMGIAMAEELEMVFRAVAADRSLAAVVLRGAGPHFCAGGDLKDMTDALAPPQAGEPDRLFAVNRRFGDLLQQVADQPQVVVSVVHGAARGGGFGLVCVSDIVIARRDATFAMPETGFGLPPAQILPFVAMRLSPAYARRLAFTGEPMAVEEAHQIGLVTALAEDDAGLDHALSRVLAQIKGRAPEVVAETKRLIAAVGQKPLGLLLDEGARLVAAGVRDGDGREGLTAFFEKRPPTWTKREG